MFESLKNWFTKPETRAITFGQAVASGLVIEPTTSGIPISPEKSLTLAAWYAAVRHISESIASLPLRVLERQPDGGWKVAEQHPMHHLLSCEPNTYMTSAVFREWFMVQTLLYGTGIAKLERANSGRVIAIHPIMSMYVLTNWDVTTKTIEYIITKSPFTEAETLGAADVIAVPGLTLNAIMGVSPVEYSRDSMALSIALERFGSSFMKNGARLSGFLKTQGQLSAQAKANLKESFKRANSGTSNTGEVAVLEEGLDFQPNSLGMEEAQYFQSKQHQIREQARWAKISPTKVGDLTRATWSNLAEENRGYVESTLSPWIHKLEQEFDRKLLLPSEQGRYRFDFDVAGLLQSDEKSMLPLYVAASGGPVLTPNESRAKLGLPPVEGGDTLRTALNMGAVGNDPQQPQQGDMQDEVKPADTEETLDPSKDKESE